MNTTLSNYFPKGTEYFYAYPAGESSHFLNKVDPETEELVAARPLLYAGPHVRVMVFASTLESSAWRIMRDELDAIPINENQIIKLPAEIASNIRGSARNTLVKLALEDHATPGKLVMAQPFNDPELNELYQINPDTAIWFNDKKHMTNYIPSRHLSKRFASYQSGKSFATSKVQFPLPAVVKVSSSSSGDGVYICHTIKDLDRAKNSLQDMRGSIFVEQYIESTKNFGIQFAIPFNINKPIEIIGFNQQITSDDGEFMGGVIDAPENHPELQDIYGVMLNQILPKVRAKGWYGVGGFDVLVEEDGSFYFIDCNFRVTGMSAAIFLVKNNIIKKNLVSFSGSFEGSERKFLKKLAPLAKRGKAEQILEIIALTEQNGVFKFNAALLYNNRYALQENAQMLLKLGVKSALLEKLAGGSSDEHFSPSHSLDLVAAPSSLTI